MLVRTQVEKQKPQEEVHERFTGGGNTLRDLPEGMVYVTVRESQAGPKSQRVSLGQRSRNSQALADALGPRQMFFLFEEASAPLPVLWQTN